MTRLSWNEIRARAARFAEEWEGETYEKGESQSFWADFLDVFGINRRRAGGYFEYAVKLSGGRRGYIDMFLPGRLLAEQKSGGRDLNTARGQAFEYLDGLDDHDLPQAVVLSDFATFQHVDLDTRQVVEFRLEELPDYVRLFAALVDEQATSIEETSPVNRQAAERMAELHNRLEAAGYIGHKLELFLVRLVFCLFAEDAGIFEPKQFRDYIRSRTAEDGTDTGLRLTKLFEVLNTAPEERSALLDDDLKAFPYVNGGLFAENTPAPDFDANLRLALLLASQPDWHKVSPAIFGAMFQGVMDGDDRHDLGAHYTSEENILRVIKPLFLDDLYAEFEKARASKNSAQLLDAFHDKLASLTFLDPACGSGNFLIVAYRELRRLELKVIEAKAKHSTIVVLESDLRVRVEQFYGIEIDEFPVQIARTAMWLTDHQMNLEAGRKIGHEYSRLPLTEGAHIVHANALTTDWSSVVKPEDLDFIFGNPPFLGSRTMDKGQKADLRAVAKGFPQAGFLDFVTAWYILADRMMAQNPAIEAAFVSTNSISQGEQPGILWPKLYANGNHITFAHRTFRWMNAARGVAAVHCVIVGFARTARTPALLFDYPDIAGEPVLDLVESISPYLIAGDEFVVSNRQEQISGAPSMAFGNMPADGGNLILSRSERDALLASEPAAAEWVLPYIGAKEFLQGGERWTLWLRGVTPAQLRAMPTVAARVAANRQERLTSARPHLADVPHLFAQITQSPEQPVLVIPRVSSERREYVPMAFFESGHVVADSCLAVEAGTLELFALLTSRMHMDWLRVVGGRLKSDLRYSKDVVYNNFVLPPIDDGQRASLAELGQGILNARALYPDSTLADLYDPTTMPSELRKAHSANDDYVDRLYRAEGFTAPDERVALLLDLVKEKDAAR